MKRLTNIVITDNEPQTDCLWIHKVDNAWVQQAYTSEGWITLGNVTLDNPQYSPGSEGEIIAPLVTPVFFITMDDEALEQENIATAAKIGHNKYQIVDLKGAQYGESYDITGYFHDGIIHTIIGEFDVNYDTGVISIIYKDDNTTAAPLQVANEGTSYADENLRILKAMSIYPVFFCRFAAGYGTATFNSNDGGSAYIITANGHGVKYNISKDGAITKASETDLNN